jgi:hypothetical protein
MSGRVVNMEYRHRYYISTTLLKYRYTFMSKYRKRYRRYFFGRFLYIDIDTFELINLINVLTGLLKQNDVALIKCVDGEHQALNPLHQNQQYHQ